MCLSCSAGHATRLRRPLAPLAAGASQNPRGFGISCSAPVLVYSPRENSTRYSDESDSDRSQCRDPSADSFCSRGRGLRVRHGAGLPSVGDVAEEGSRSLLPNAACRIRRTRGVHDRVLPRGRSATSCHRTTELAELQVLAELRVLAELVAGLGPADCGIAVHRCADRVEVVENHRSGGIEISGPVGLGRTVPVDLQHETAQPPATLPPGATGLPAAHRHLDICHRRSIASVTENPRTPLAELQTDRVDEDDAPVRMCLTAFVPGRGVG